MTTLVIGGGVAGAAAAHVCLDAVLCEATDRVGGRFETRTRGELVYDIGVTAIPDTGDERSTLVREQLGPDCATVRGDVEAVDPDRDAGFGCPPGTDRLTGRHGLGAVPEAMVDAAHGDLRTGTTVRTLERTADGWSAWTDSGIIEADRVVSTLRPARVAALLPDGALAADLRAEADRLSFHALDSVVLGYDHPVERDWYALATGDEREGGWLCRESAKPGHVPDGQAALVVQSRAAAPAAEQPVTTDQAAVAAADLLNDPRLADPAWTDTARYRFARPAHRAAPELLEAAAEADLYLAGDWTAGTTRTLAPVETGLDAGRRAMGFAQQATLS